MAEDQSKTCCQRFLSGMKQNILLLLIILSLILGVSVGAMIRIFDEEFAQDPRNIMYFRFPGELLMRMLRMVIIPLIVSSLISGLAGLDSKASGRMGLRTIVYYMVTTFIAVVLGIVLVTTIRPGDRSGDIDDGKEEDLPPPVNIVDSFLDLIRNMLPDNIVEACFRMTTTQQNLRENSSYIKPGTNETIEGVYDFEIVKVDGMNVLGLVVYSVAMGIIISRMEEMGKPLAVFCDALAEATMLLVTLVIWYSPIGIFFLVASDILSMDDPIQELQALGLYMATVILGLGIHGFVILPLLYLVIVKKNPYKFIQGILQAMVTAFGTASSSATLPVTYRCLEENNNIDRRVTRFVLPVGATINMDGTALYEAVAAIFIAQLENIPLNFAQIIACSITATFASIGAASIPQAGIVTMVIVLTALGLPADSVSKIIAVDWLLDRFRTMINVEGDSFGSGIIAHLSRLELGDRVEEEEELSESSSSKPPPYDGYKNKGLEYEEAMTNM